MTGARVVKQNLRTKTGCLTCRVRHLKCDETKPVCRRCQRGNRQCAQADSSLNFQPGYNPCRGNNSRGRNEAYVERSTSSSHGLQDSRSERNYQATENDTTTCNSRVNSDEESSPTLVASYFDAADYGSPVGYGAHAHQVFPQAVSMAVDRSLSSSLPPFISEPSPATKSPRAHVVSSSAGLCDARLDLPTNSSSIFSTSERDSTNDVMLLSSTDSGAQFQCHAALESSEQARLFRLFIDTWGPGLDATDSKRHFTYDIPHRALTTPVLLNAMLSIASLQESKILKSDSLIAERYYEESVGLLIRLLGDSSIVTDEVLLATTVILRIYEQMNVPVYSNDNERHLHGSSALVSTYPSTNSTLRRAAFYIYLRQDVYMAIVAQRLVKVELPSCSQPPPASDSEWSNLIVLIVAKIVNFCFAKDSERSSRRWSDLREVVDEWNAKRPNTFDPYYYRERNIFEGRYFPDVWLSAQWHVTGNLYSHLAQVLLSIYDPNIRVGMGALRQQKILQNEIIRHARNICGICFSNGTTETRRTTCYALVVCGPYFSDAEEQGRILQLLKRIEAEDGWPTQSVVQTPHESTFKTYSWFQVVFTMQDAMLRPESEP